jgi:hypothetical protein
MDDTKEKKDEIEEVDELEELLRGTVNLNYLQPPPGSEQRILAAIKSARPKTNYRRWLAIAAGIGIILSVSGTLVYRHYQAIGMEAQLLFAIKQIPWALLRIISLPPVFFLLVLWPVLKLLKTAFNASMPEGGRDLKQFTNGGKQ